MSLDFNGVRKIWQFEQSPLFKRAEQQWKEIVPKANKLAIGISLELLLLSENFRLCEEFKYVSERCLYLKKTSVSSEKSKQWTVFLTRTTTRNELKSVIASTRQFVRWYVLFFIKQCSHTFLCLILNLLLKIKAVF